MKPSARDGWRRTGRAMWAGGVWFVLLGGPVLYGSGGRSMPLGPYAAAATAALHRFVSDYFLTWSFLAFLAAVVALEAWVPANRRQRVLSVGARYDLTIGAGILIYWFFVLPLYVELAFDLLNRYVPFLKLVQAPSLPWYGSWPLAFLFQDFILWGSHYIRHKVPLLWRFHAMHHSQRELNAFSEFRFHPADTFASRLLIIVPLYVVDMPVHSAAALIIAQKWFLMFVHSNTRVRLGALSYLLVTPAFHRIHHSVEARHADVNFGVYLSLWDWLFGTRRETGPDEQFETGTVDYPVEQRRRWRDAPAVYLTQLLYPLRPLVSLSRHSQDAESPARRFRI